MAALSVQRTLSPQSSPLSSQSIVELFFPTSFTLSNAYFIHNVISDSLVQEGQKETNPSVFVLVTFKLTHSPCHRASRRTTNKSSQTFLLILKSVKRGCPRYVFANGALHSFSLFGLLHSGLLMSAFGMRTCYHPLVATAERLLLRRSSKGSLYSLVRSCMLCLPMQPFLRP